MNINLDWPKTIADNEGDYLNPETLSALDAFAQSFPRLQSIYQQIQKQEGPLITELLREHGVNPLAQLPPRWVTVVERIACYLRSLALAVLTQNPQTLKVNLQWGDMDLFLDIPHLLSELNQRILLSIPREELPYLQPFLQLLQMPLATEVPLVALPALSVSEVSVPETPTLMEMFH